MAFPPPDGETLSQTVSVHATGLILGDYITPDPALTVYVTNQCGTQSTVGYGGSLLPGGLPWLPHLDEKTAQLTLQAPITISIDPFVGVCKDGQFNTTIRVMGASSATTNLTLQRISGSMGEARFAANNMTTLNNVTISSAGTAVAIKGVTQSDLADNLRLTATLTSAGQQATEAFSVISVEVVDVLVCADQILSQVYPSGVNGIFTLQITRPGGQQPVVLVDRQMRAGGTGFIDGIGIDNVNTFPAGTYQAVEAIWNVGGVECRKQFDRFPMPFTVLESNWRITCYNTPFESDFGAPNHTLCTSNAQCQWTPGQSFNSTFLDRVSLNGSGMLNSGAVIQPEAFLSTA
jgi:hypothetical protein